MIEVGQAIILTGDVSEMLTHIPDKSVQCVVTSPPYFGLRDYGVDGQIGLEQTPQAYVEKLVSVFREVRRVLRDDGTVWLNLGDSYGGPKGNTAMTGGKHDEARGRTMFGDIGRKFPGQAKQLLGIPWRVAFALQAPYYHGRIKQERDRAWLAGLVDGEGCITILEAKSPHGSGSSYPPVLQVRMCDVECIEHAARITGYGTDAPMVQEPPSQPGQRGSYQWRLHGRKAADTIAEIYPYLLIKRKQAIVAWNHQAVRDGYETKRGVKIPADALEKQIACRDLIQRLNRREPVDIPDWMIEPPAPYGQGWYLRQDVIWSKPNPMPESVRDRCTKAHEYIFMLTKREKYYFDNDAIKEPLACPAELDRKTPAKFGGANKWQEASKQSRLHSGNEYKRKPQTYSTPYTGESTKDYETAGAQDASATKARIVDRILSGEITGRNKRSVWWVSPKPFKGAHFATFPPDLIEPCNPRGIAPW